MWKFFFFVILSFQICLCFVKGDDFIIGDDCEIEEDCENITNAICNSDNVCDCEKGYVASLNNKSCLPLALKIGDKCEISEQCSDLISAKCVAKICVSTEARTILMTTLKPPNECTENSQCPDFENICINGTCVKSHITPKLFGLDGTIIGKPCSNNSDCPIEGSACIGNLCKCKEGFVTGLNLKACLPKAKALGDNCTETAQCISLSGSICENGKCTSPKDNKFFKSLAAAADKLPPLMIGSTCQSNEECKHLANAMCMENVCQCAENYITSVTSNSCLLKAKKEGDLCEIDKQCEDVKEAVCNKNICVKPGVAGTKIGYKNKCSAIRISQLAMAILIFKYCFYLN